MADPLIVALSGLHLHLTKAAEFARFLQSYREFELAPEPAAKPATTELSADAADRMRGIIRQTAHRLISVVGDEQGRRVLFTALQEHRASSISELPPIADVLVRVLTAVEAAMPPRRAQRQNAPLDPFPSTQDEGDAGARPEQGSPAREGRERAEPIPSQGDQFVAASDAGEGIASPADPVSAPDDGQQIPELPASDGEKGEAPASSSPECDVSSLDLPAPASSEAAPALSRQEPKKPTVPLSQTQRILIEYERTGDKAPVIATRLGYAANSVSATISGYRKKGNGRVRAGDVLASKNGTPPAAPREVRVVEVPERERRVPRHVESERPLPVTGAALSKPACALKPVSRPKVAGVLKLVPIGCIAIDEDAKVIAGPLGEWIAYSSAVIVMKRLAALKPGQMLDAQALSSGGMAKSRILESIATWQREMAMIGIELGRNGEMFWLKRMETAA